MLKAKRKIIISIICLITFLVISFIIFTIFCKKNSKIISKIYINDIDVSKMSIDEANKILLSKTDSSKSLHLTYKDFETTILPSEIDFSFDISSTVQEAYSIGRTNNIFVNCFQIISALFSPKHISVKYNYNQEKLDAILNNINYELPGIMVEPSYYIENDSLIVCKGSDGIILCKSDTKNFILSALSNLNSSNVIEIDIPVQFVSPHNIDIDKIYNEIYSEVQNAYIEKEPFNLHINQDGIDFAISMEEAKTLLQSDSSEYIIPLKITKPDITINDLDKEIFVDTLATYTTRYNVNNVNRSNNVEIATSKLNNVIIFPDEIFSYNKTVGERTISAGYKEASIYTSNGVESGLGGGVCQVSSTLYNAILRANLDIVERKNHRYSVPYVPLGCDATVSYGSIDFKFKNSRKYPIKLQAYAKNGIVSISVIGMNEDVEYDISFSTKQVYTIPFETKYIYDSALSSASQIIEQKGSYGYKINNYKIIKLNNSIISESLISSDTYSPLTQIIRIGN